MKRFHAESLTPIGFVTRGFLLLPPAFLITLKYDVPHVLILTFLLILLPAFRKQAPSFGKGLLLFFLSISVLLAVIPSFMFEVDSGRITVGDVFLRAHIFVPLLLYAVAFACGLRRSREITSFIVPTVLFITLICGDLPMAKTLHNSRFPLSDELLHQFRYVYLVCSSLQFFGVLMLLTAEARLDSVSTPEERGRSARLRFLLFLLIPCLMVGETGLYLKNEAGMKRIERSLLYSLRRRMTRGTRFSPDEVRIASSFREDGLMPTGEVLLRVRATESPGYLRGRVYDSYNGGVWRASPLAKTLTELRDISLDKDLSVGYFPFRNDSIRREGHPVEIFFSRSFHAENFPIPPRTLGVEMVADSVSLSSDGVLLAKNPSRSAGYIAWIPSFDPDGAFQKPEKADEPEKNRFLTLPREAPSRTVRYLSRRLLAFRRGNFSSREAMHLVTHFLKNNYLYSLDPGTESRFAIRRLRKLPPPEDPVERFLIHTGAGHCELFASSAVLLLRSMGIPARYVTGFACGEQYSSGVYYITDRDAHAWAEAYDVESGKWILLDPTPSVWRQDGPGARTGNFWESFQNSSESFFDRVAAFVVRGYAGRLISEWLRAFGAWLLLFVREPMGIAFLAVLVFSAGGAAVIFRRIFDPLRSYPPDHAQALRIMMKLETRLALRTHIRRADGQTWSEWTELFRTYSFFPALKKLTARYEGIRYRPAGFFKGKEECRTFDAATEAFWKEAREMLKRDISIRRKRKGSAANPEDSRSREGL